MTVKAPASEGPDNTGLYGGIVLGLSAIAALIVANSPLGPHYEALLRMTGEVRIGSIGLSKTVDHWINDGLMAVFFLLVGVFVASMLAIRLGLAAMPEGTTTTKLYAMAIMTGSASP